MSDDIAPDGVAPVTDPVVSSETAGSPAPEAPAETPSVVEQVVSEVEQVVEPLASEVEVVAQHATEAAYREVASLEAAANVAVGAIDAHTVGLLHSDTVYREAEKIGNEGPRQEQIHTSLKAG